MEFSFGQGSRIFGILDRLSRPAVGMTDHTGPLPFLIVSLISALSCLLVLNVAITLTGLLLVFSDGISYRELI